jgi:hypothetical protein
MKKILIVLIMIVVFSPYILAQAMSSGYFVVPNDKMNEDVRQQLGNKIKVALTNAGVAATDGFSPMFTVVKYDETETIELSGMKKMYKTSGEVSIMMLFENTKTTLAASSFSVEGVGVSKTVAQAAAIKNINIPESEIKNMVEKASKNYPKIKEDYSKRKLAEAKKLQAQGDAGGAIEAASSIPADSKLSKEAQSFIEKLNQKREKDEAAAEKRRDEREKQDFELQKKQMEEDSKINQENLKQQHETVRAFIEARSRVEERYYRAWQAYYSGK